MRRKDNPLHMVRLKMEEERTFSGYASVFNKNDAYNDTVVPGAYAEQIKSGRMPMMFYQHNPDQPIGKWLEMKEDDYGLKVTGEFTPDHSLAKDVRALMKHGALDGLSIGYRTVESEQKEDGGEILKRLKLIEISPVSMPADEYARVSDVKSIDEVESFKDAEAYLRDLGASRSEATAFVARCKRLCEKGQTKPKAATLDDLREILEKNHV